MEFIYWENDSGKSPVYDFMRKQGDKKATKLDILISDLGKWEFPVLLRTQKVKKLDDDLYEVRLPAGGDKYRFLFPIRKGFGFLVEAFKKTTQKTPPQHMKTARERTKILDKQISEGRIN